MSLNLTGNLYKVILSIIRSVLQLYVPSRFLVHCGNTSFSKYCSSLSCESADEIALNISDAFTLQYNNFSNSCIILNTPAVQFYIKLLQILYYYHKQILHQRILVRLLM